MFRSINWKRWLNTLFFCFIVLFGLWLMITGQVDRGSFRLSLSLAISFTLINVARMRKERKEQEKEEAKKRAEDEEQAPKPRSLRKRVRR